MHIGRPVDLWREAAGTITPSGSDIAHRRARRARQGIEMVCIRSFMRPAAAALVSAAAAAGPVHAITIQTGSYSNSGIGAEFATPYDSFVVTGDTITIAPPSAPVVVTL